MTHIIKCRATGLVFNDVGVRAISVSNERRQAMKFTDKKEAETIIKFLSTLYGSFDWHVIPLEG